jgi:hypothetical protein
MSDIKYLDASALRGKTITSIKNVEGNQIQFSTSDGNKYLMRHRQECCEMVSVHDIIGELTSLVGSPLIVAREEAQGDEWPNDAPPPEYRHSFTWTTYFLETERSKVRIRWLGRSNGYYSESVQIDELT